MCRYRLEPTPGQEAVLLRHCADARYVWNLAVEQHAWWRPGRISAPGYLEQCRQLTAARAANRWLAEGSQMVQQQALRDFDQATRNFFSGTHRRPTWRKVRRDEGFRIVALKPEHVRKLNRKLSRAKRGSNRRARVRRQLARALACDADARKDWAEKTSTSIALRYDLIRIEDLKIRNITRSARGTNAAPGRNVAQKAGLNRAILASGWGMFATRLQQKASGRVEKINPAYTSQTCSQCKTIDREARESQAVFRCRACGYCGNADVNAARNIAAGHAVTARGRSPLGGRLNREPQLGLLAS